ncbi:hypothetical protein SELMODRAFT_99756 [Selaginella moellendorffii]|uniref:Pentacotripeptide-repeat region of PRORP domain-containing protein n=2 Tax=Selaginella moellendorffii TaxID=88036 RepID=D8RRG5_SELML|nr:hypothetical protein SELMODRAFT_99756 [Selaginella moellendorffii]
MHCRKLRTLRESKAGVPFDRGKLEQQQKCLTLLQQCQDSGELDVLYARFTGTGYLDNVYFRNWLIQLHGKFGNTQKSREVFDGMQQKNVYSWSMMIGAYAQNGHRNEAFLLFERMESEGIRPNAVTCLHVLGACSYQNELPFGKKVHAYISASEFKWDISLQTSLVNMYAKCGSPADAKAVFDSMARKDIVTWNAMAGASVHNGQSHKLLREMDLQGVKPNATTYASITRGSSTLTGCRAMEQRLLASGYMSHVPVQNALVNVYAKCGDLEGARKVFNRLERKDVISWSTMISAYNQSGRHSEAIEIYRLMESETSVEPNAVTFVGVIGACTGCGDVIRGIQVHGRLVSLGLETDVAVGSALVQMYVKCGSLEDAKKAFDRVEKRDVLCWNFMLSAYSERGSPQQVIEAYEAMDVEPNAVTYTNVLIACSAMEDLAQGQKVHSRIVSSGLETDMTMETALLSLYIKCRSLKSACQVFEAMGKKDVIPWNFMMVGYIDHDCDTEALRLYARMHEAGVEANNVTFANALKACSKIKDIETGSKVEAMITTKGFETDVVTDTALLNMYAACGDLEAAKRVFGSRRGERRDVVFWTAMIASYAQAGRGEEALALYKTMLSEEIKPNSVTYTSVLSACSSLGNILEGRKIHSKLEGKAEELDVAVQNSLLSMYARCGSLRDAWSCFAKIHNRDVFSWTGMVAAFAHHGHSARALELVREMELCGVSPDAVTFQSVLHACSHEGSLERGWASFVSMAVDYAVEPSKDHYLCMVDLLARAGRLAEAREVIQFVGLERESMGWMMLLGASRTHSNLAMGVEAAQCVAPEDGLAMCPLLCSVYVL